MMLNGEISTIIKSKMDIIEQKLEFIEKLGEDYSELWLPEKCPLAYDGQTKHWGRARLVFGLNCNTYTCGFCGKTFYA